MLSKKVINKHLSRVALWQCVITCKQPWSVWHHLDECSHHLTCPYKSFFKVVYRSVSQPAVLTWSPADQLAVYVLLRQLCRWRLALFTAAGGRSRKQQPGWFNYFHQAVQISLIQFVKWLLLHFCYKKVVDGSNGDVPCHPVFSLPLGWSGSNEG